MQIVSLRMARDPEQMAPVGDPFGSALFFYAILSNTVVCESLGYLP